jgi:hypothetical protein
MVPHFKPNQEIIQTLLELEKLCLLKWRIEDTEDAVILK